MNSKFFIEENGDGNLQNTLCFCSEHEQNLIADKSEQKNIILKTIEKYCWCLQDLEMYHSHLPPDIKNQICISSYIRPLKSFSIDPRTEVRCRKRRGLALEVGKCVDKIYKLMLDGSLTFIVGKSKVKLSYYDSPKPRSSNYIGVSKNGENWQVLINCGKSKRYIGTYFNEMEAAITYDFYSICLHFSNAKTNFTYDLKLINLMMNCYDNKRKKFYASRFIELA